MTARFFRGGLETRQDVDLPYPHQQAKSIHHRCLKLAERHQAAVFHGAVTSFDAVQGIVLLAIWKEADDDKAAHRFNRAVMIAKEMKLNRVETTASDDPEEARWQRATRRLWCVESNPIEACA